MSKFLNIPTGNYSIKVQPSGQILLDTGDEGNVTIKGSLIVEGETVTVNTRELEVEDKVVQLNVLEQGPLISGTPGNRFSGIEINRGANTEDARFVFDEDLDFENQNVGAFTMYTTDGSTKNLISLQTDGIFTAGGDLKIGTGAAGDTDNPGLIRTMASNYTNKLVELWQVDQDISETSPVKDYIPNMEFVKEFVNYFAGANPPSETTVGDTKFQAKDSDITPGISESVLNLIVDNNLIGAFTTENAVIQDVEISGSTITGLLSGDDLNLVANGGGSVRIADTLLLDTISGGTPITPSTGTVVYYDNDNTKDTGIYYKNSTGKEGEISSRRSAVLFSLIF